MLKSKRRNAVVSAVLAVLMVTAFMPAITYSSFAATAKKATRVTKVYHTANKTFTVKKGTSWTLKYKLSPSKLTSRAKATVWKTDYSNIVSIKKLSGNRAKVTFKRTGNAYVKVYCKYNKKVQTKWKFRVVSSSKSKTTTLESVNLSAPNAAAPTTSLNVGTTLRADVAPSDASNVTYQWYADGVAITGATANSFKVTTDQIGKRITVRATSKNTVESAQTAAVAAPSVSNVAIGRVNANEDTSRLNVGTQLKVSATLQNASALKDVASIQWYRVGTSTNGSEQETLINGASDETYTVTKDDIGYRIRVKVIGNNGVTINGTNTQTSTNKVSGEVAVSVQSNGRDVTAVSAGTQLTAAVTPADASVTYRWYKKDGSNSTPVTNAVSSTFTPTSNGTYYVEVTLNNEKTYTIDGKSTGSVKSNDVVVGSSTFSESNITATNTTAETRKDSHVLPGDVVTVQAPVLGGYASITAQLYKDGKAVGTATAAGDKATLTIPSDAKVGDVYSILVQGTGDYAGTSYTLSKTFTVDALGNLSAGATATFTIDKTSTGTTLTLGDVKLGNVTLNDDDYTIQWYGTTATNTTGVAIAGATAKRYTVTTPKDDDYTEYYAVITGANGHYIGSYKTDPKAK